MELTTQPLSSITALTPRRLSSIPQASPVGPAPTTTTSKLSTLEHLLDAGIDAAEGARPRRRIFSASLGHVRPASALSADSLGVGAHEPACVHLRGQVLGDPGDDRHACILGGAGH